MMSERWYHLLLPFVLHGVPEEFAGEIIDHNER
jgi:hypothetical protein